MKRDSSDTLLQDMSDKIQVIFEGVGAMQEKMETLATQASVDALTKRVDTIEIVVTETNKDLRKLGERLTKRIDELDERLGGRMDSFDARFDKLDAKVSNIDAKVGRLDVKLSKVDNRLARVEGRLLAAA